MTWNADTIAIAEVSGLWPLDESSGALVDSVSTNDGTAGGSPVYGVAGFAKIGGTGLQFDGTDDYVTVAHNAAFDFDIDGSFAVECWVKPLIAREGATASFALVSKMDGSSPYGGWAMGVRRTADLRRLVVETFLIDDYPNNYHQQRWTIDLHYNQWSHVRWVVTAGTPFASAVYVNGRADYVNETLSAGTVASVANEHPLRIADRNGIQFAPCVVANVATFNGVPSDNLANRLRALFTLTERAKVNLLRDCDTSDPDDHTGMGCTFHLHQYRKLNLLGVLLATNNANDARTYAAILGHYDRYHTIPINYLSTGPAKNQTVANAVLTAFPRYAGLSYDGTAVASARQILANAADASVTYLCTGPASLMHGVLDSAADGISELTGKELIVAKVARTIVIAGFDPDGDFYGTADSNNSTDKTSSNHVAGGWPMAIDWQPIDIANELQFGWEVIAQTNPITTGLAAYPGADATGYSRPNWDAISLLHILYDEAELFDVVTGGHAAVDVDTGVWSWNAGARNVADVGDITDRYFVSKYADSFSGLWCGAWLQSAPRKRVVLSGAAPLLSGTSAISFWP